MFTNPRPTELELAVYDRTRYRLDYQLSVGKPGQRHVRKMMREAVQRHAVLAPCLGGRKLRMLDFGCGSGDLLRHFALEGHCTTGPEPGSGYARHAVDLAPTAGPFRIDSAPWPSVADPAAPVELVSMLHVPEHLPRPVAALAAIHRWLTPGGLLHVEVPNMKGYDLKGVERVHFADVISCSRDNLIHAASLAGFSLLAEPSPTSLIFAKPGGEACQAIIDLKGTARRNRTACSEPLTVPRWLTHHARRLMRRMLSRSRQQRSPAALLNT
jgi:SAM-dependent methyltransferase